MAVKILSVDDEMDLELLLTQYFRRKIRNGEYEFTFAHNGLEALTLLLKNSGNVDFTNVEVTDATLGTVFSNEKVPAGKTVTLTKELTITENGILRLIPGQTERHISQWMTTVNG